MEKTDQGFEAVRESGLESGGSSKDGSSFEEGSVGASVEREPAQEISSSERDASYAKIAPQLDSSDDSSSSDHAIPEDAKEVSLRTDADSQIQHLVDIAMIKGVMHAVKVAKHIEDNYVLDSFHDRLLSEELSKALTEKGLVKED